MPFAVRSLLLFMGALPLSFALRAQALPQGVHLGMSSDELKAAVPDIQRVARPQRLAGGLAGAWRGAPVEVAGVSLEPTFYFAGPVLSRVEWMGPANAQPDRGAAAFAALLDWGRAQFGAETVSRDPGAIYAAWTTADTDVYAQHADDAQRATVRFVYKARQRKDASEL